MNGDKVKNYQLVVNVGDMIAPIFCSSEDNLVQLYKDSILNDKRFFVWEDGCFELKNVVGVYKQ